MKTKVVNELQIKMQNNSILTPTSSSSATPGTRFLVRATSFARQALQAQQKRMESPDVVAQNADVAADEQKSIRPSKPPNFLDWELMWGIFRATSKGAICALLRCAEPCPAVPRWPCGCARPSASSIGHVAPQGGKETPCTQHNMCVQLLR